MLRILLNSPPHLAELAETLLDELHWVFVAVNLQINGGSFDQVEEVSAKWRKLQPSGRSSGQAGKLWSSGGNFSCSDKAFSCSRSFGRVGYFDQVVKFQLTRNFSTFYITFFKEEHVFSQYTGSNSFKYPIKCHRILTKGSDLSWTLSHHTRDILLHFLLQPLLTLHLFDEHGERDQIIGILGHHQVLRTVIKCCVSFCTVSEAQNQHVKLLF